MEYDLTQLVKDLWRRYRWTHSWPVTGEEVLAVSGGHAHLIAHRKRIPPLRAVRHYLKTYRPSIDHLPDPTDLEAVADSIYREIGIGAESAITARELAKRLLIPVYRVRQGVRLLREEGILVVGGVKGCYLPGNDDEAEAAIRILEKRRDGLNRTIRLLRAAKARTSERAIKIAQPVEVTGVRGTAG